MENTVNHFWYSPLQHEHEIALGNLEKLNGIVSRWFSAHLNYVELEICGEKVEVEYTAMSENFHAYDKWDTKDWVYLGSAIGYPIRIVDINPVLSNPDSFDNKY